MLLAFSFSLVFLLALSIHSIIKRTDEYKAVPSDTKNKRNTRRKGKEKREKKAREKARVNA